MTKPHLTAPQQCLADPTSKPTHQRCLDFALLWSARGHISGDRYDVVLVQFPDDALHQFGHAAGASALLKAIELADDIDWVVSRDFGHFTQTHKRWAVADGTSKCLSRTAGRN